MAMRSAVRIWLVLALLCNSVSWGETRALWTTSRLKGSPDPPAPYRTEVAFRGLRFHEPLDLTAAPGSNRLFVAEQSGKIFSFPNDPETRSKDLLIDLQQMVLGFTFHPEFDRNGYFFVTYLADGNDAETGTRVVRLKITQQDPPKSDWSTATPVLGYPAGGHNGGCLKFGPDGCLYIATGDGSGIADQRLTGQDLTSLAGAILRVDVDRSQGEHNYTIPPDNPFHDLDGARAEIWAYGLRQPWRFSFDKKTGDLWAGNVGQDLWEQIYLIQPGGNYGWSVVEGSHPFRPDRARGPSPILMPVVEHDHAEFRSITGGYVYHGSRLSGLTGAYVYGDYDTGKIWTFRYDQAGQVTQHRELVDSSLRLVGFAELNDGGLLLVDHMGGQIHRLMENSAADNSADFPRQLSDTGLFKSVAKHEPATGLLAYEVLAPQWVDGATKERYLAIPGGGLIEFDGITYPQPAPGAPHGWKFPDGTVLVETLSLEMEVGNPASRRRLETRVLHHEKLTGGENVGDQYWRGYTYIWNDEQTDATLLEDPHGQERVFKIEDPTSPSGMRQQTWRFPGRAECTVCHNMAAKYVLGFNTIQLNRPCPEGSSSRNQLERLESQQFFTRKLPARPADLPKLVAYGDENAPLAARARSYMHGNCSHCHRKWGGGNAEFLLLATVSDEAMGVLSRKAQHGSFQMTNAGVVSPGLPEKSVLYYRMSTVGPGRMPRIGSNVTDVRGVALIHDWIAALERDSPRTKPENLLTLVTADAQQRPKLVRSLLANTSDSLSLARAMDEGQFSAQQTQEILQWATSDDTPSVVKDLFERFLPEEKRTKRLGSAIRPEQILSLDGSVDRGAKLFFESNVQCRNCHQIQGRGKPVGPDLSQIGKKRNSLQLLDAMLNPSREIDPKYRVVLVETAAGQVHTGLLVARSEEEIVLKNAKNETIRLPASEVEHLIPQQQSLMPDLLLRDLTAQQVADLTAFLNALK